MIELPDVALDLAVRPTHHRRGIVATALISGHVVGHRYTIPTDEDDGEGDAKFEVRNLKSKEVFKVKLHKGSCRAVDFGTDGKVLFTAGKDKTLAVIDADTSAIILKKKDAHKEAINTVLAVDSNVVVTGDEAGVVNVWDTRQRKLAQHYAVQTEYISAFAQSPSDSNTLLATSSDGTLAVFDIRKSKPVQVSDPEDDELSCVQFVRHSKKAIVGTSGGLISLYTAGNWGDTTDRMPPRFVYGSTAKAASVDALVRIDENNVAAGCGDGAIRIVHVLPNRIDTVVPTGDDGIERLVGVEDGEGVGWLMGCSHDAQVRCWRVPALVAHGRDGDSDDEDSGAGEEESVEDDESEDEEEDDDEDDEDEAGSQVGSDLGGLDRSDNDEDDEDSDASGDDYDTSAAISSESTSSSATAKRPNSDSTVPVPKRSAEDQAPLPGDESDGRSKPEKKRPKVAAPLKTKTKGARKGGAGKPVFEGLD